MARPMRPMREKMLIQPATQAPVAQPKVRIAASLASLIVSALLSSSALAAIGFYAVASALASSATLVALVASSLAASNFFSAALTASRASSTADFFLVAFALAALSSS